jgi:hypothetical protein
MSLHEVANNNAQAVPKFRVLHDRHSGEGRNPLLVGRRGKERLDPGLRRDDER